MIKHGEPNPLAVFEMREMTHCPPHFQKLLIDLYAQERTLRNWIYENIEGRFYFGQAMNEEGKFSTCIAFESHQEATYFALHLPQLNVFDSF